MKKLSLVAVLSVLALLLAGLAWWVSRKASAPAAAVETATSAAAPAEPAPAEIARATELQGGDLEKGSDVRAELASAPGKDGGFETWDLSKSVWVSGVVRSPAGCNDDGPIEVFALSEQRDADDLARLVDSKSDAGRAEPVLLSRRAVEPNGAFRLPFPPGKDKGWVAVMGRYLYVLESIEVDLARGPGTVSIDASCGAWITGKVTVPADSPVTLAELDGMKIRVGTSSEAFRGSPGTQRGFRREVQLADGAFELRAVPPKGPAAATCEPERLAAAEAEMKEVLPGRENPVMLRLQRGGKVSGVVKGPEGEPVAGAEVVAARPGAWFGFDDREVREAKSAADGTFELPAVSPGKVVLRAKADGYLDAERKKIDVQDGGVEPGVELLLAAGSAVSGTVAWADGTPAAKIEVNAKFDMSQMVGMGAFNALRGAEGKSATDAAGAFRIAGLGNGPFTIVAEAPPPGVEKRDSKSKDEWRARADGVKPGASGLALVLRAPEGVAGRVVDEQDAPIPKFRIEAQRSGQGMLGSLGQESREDDFEDAEGRFLLTGLFEGTWKLHAIAEGFGAADPVEIVVPRGASEPEISIKLLRAAAVAGIVKGPDGERVAGATVKIDTGQPAWQTMGNARSDAPTAKSGPDGAFEIEGLKPGKISLVADDDQHARSAPVAFELAPGQTVEGAELVMAAGGTLTGEVFADNGKPAQGMLVQATEMKIFEMEMTFSDAKGEFRFEHVPAGSWQVVAMPARGGEAGEALAGETSEEGMMSLMSKMKMAMVSIAESETTHVVLGAPPKDPVSVHGKVTHAGEPWAGAMISFVAEGKDGFKAMKFKTVGKDGEYAVQVDAPGRYVVSVQKVSGAMGQQNLVEFAREIPEVKEHRLDLELPTGRISGRVTGPAGAPEAGARVSLHPEDSLEVGTFWGGQYVETTTDSDGTFDLKALRAGTYTIAVGGTSLMGLFGGEAATNGREIKSGLRVSDGEWMRDLDFRLKKPGTLEVTVVDASGAPAPEAAVFARDKDGRLIDLMSMTSTDASGKCKYGGLTPGTYTVSARKDLLVSVDSARVRVEEGETAQAQVGLQAGTILLVTCQGAEQAPVQAAVSVEDEQGREVGAMFSLSDIMKLFSEGGFSSTEHRVGPVPPGKYKIRAQASDGKVEHKIVNVNGQAERKVILRFGE